MYRKDAFRRFLLQIDLKKKPFWIRYAARAFQFHINRKTKKSLFGCTESKLKEYLLCYLKFYSQGFYLYQLPHWLSNLPEPENVGA